MVLLYSHFFSCIILLERYFKKPFFEIFMRAHVVNMRIVMKPLINS